MTGPSGSLRERLAKVSADEVRREVAPLLKEVERAAQRTGASAAAIDGAVAALHRDRKQRLRGAVVVGVVLLLVAALLPAVYPRWTLSPDERRWMRIGQRIEHAWATLPPAERRILEHVLR